MHCSRKWLRSSMKALTLSPGFDMMSPENTQTKKAGTKNDPRIDRSRSVRPGSGWLGIHAPVLGCSRDRHHRSLGRYSDWRCSLRSWWLAHPSIHPAPQTVLVPLSLREAAVLENQELISVRPNYVGLAVGALWLVVGIVVLYFATVWLPY